MSTIDEHRATVHYGGRVVDASQATITLDRGYSPYVQGSIRVPADTSLDPRDGDRVLLTLRQTFGDSATAAEVGAAHPGATAASMSALWSGLTAAQVSALHFTPWNRFGVRPSTSRTLDLVVVGSSTSRRARETVLTVASDEAIAQGHILVSTRPETFGSLSVRAIVSQVLGAVGAQLLAGTADGTLDQAATWEPGETAWDFMAPLVQQAGLRLWCDGRRAWRLDDDQATTGGTITLSSRDRVVDASLDIDLDGGDWADAVVIRYRWRDSNNVEQTRYDVAGATRPRRGVLLEYTDTPYPGPGAAAQVLRRRSRRGRVAPVEAVSDYSTEPGMAFLLTVDELAQQAGVVQAVEWRLPAAEMTVRPIGLEDINPQGIRAIPATYQINQLPGTIAQLRPGAL